MYRLCKIILALFCCCSFLSAQADDLDPESAAFLTNKAYAKNIEVKAYLVTKDQLAKLFSEKNGEVIQKTNKELFDEEVFLLVRVKNKGNHRSFGHLNCTIPNRGVPITFDIGRMNCFMKSSHDSVLYLGTGLVPNDDKTPVIRCEWKSLYTM